jgi:hypothetical protein
MGADHMSQPSLFEAPSESKKVALADLPLVHPYARYGLAVALSQAGVRPWEMPEDDLREALAQAIESGLESFRMKTDDDPQITRLLRFSAIFVGGVAAGRDSGAVERAGGARHLHLPDGHHHGRQRQGHLEERCSALESLRGGKKLDTMLDLSRSFAPTTAKINNGTASQTPPKGTLLEVACALITTLTPLKPAAWPGRNTTVIPDLELGELRDFVGLFREMSLNQSRKDLMEWQLPELPKPKADGTAKRAPAKKAGKKDAPPKSEFHRPRLHSGNYPYAPRDAGIFGAVGLLGAIGRWAREAGQVPWAARVLESLAGKPIYIVSYDSISVVRFGHHIVSLSLRGELSEMIDALWRDTILYADLESPRPRRDAPAYQLFYLQASRFLQLLSPPAFADFLSARAEYPPQLRPLFKEYFMSIDPAIVHSAGELGQWLNYTAYRVADGEFEAAASDRASRVRKAKAKILVEFESAAMSAKSPTDMLSRISIRCGRLLNDDAPAGAKRFMDATASGEISQQEATHLLIAYMRLRSAPAKAQLPKRLRQTNRQIGKQAKPPRRTPRPRTRPSRSFPLWEATETAHAGLTQQRKSWKSKASWSHCSLR